MSHTELEYNEHNIRQTTVNGKRLDLHRGFDSSHAATARRLLATEDAIVDASVSKYSLTVWVRDADAINWRPPRGYTIDAISAFTDSDEHLRPAIAIVLKRDD